VPSITAAYGMRRLRTAYTGSILRIRRSSDNTEQDIGYTATGDLDTSAISTFIGGGNGYIVNWYDQSGNAYTASQSTTANQPLYVASGQNGGPIGRWDTTDRLLMSVNLAQPHTYLIANSVSSGYPRIVDGQNNAGNIGFYDANNSYVMWSGAVALVGSAPYYGASILVPFFQGVSSTLYRNGALLGTVSPSTNSVVGMQLLEQGDRYELIIANTAWSTSDRQTAEAISNAYWAVYSVTAPVRDTTTTYSSSAGSAKIVTPAASYNYTQAVNVGDTNTYNLSAYAYTDGTTVTSADAELFYNGSTVSTTYTSVGSGW